MFSRFGLDIVEWIDGGYFVCPRNSPKLSLTIPNTQIGLLLHLTNLSPRVTL